MSARRFAASLRARSSSLSVGGSCSKTRRGQPQRAQIDRACPRRPVRDGPNRELQGAAADVADGDRIADFLAGGDRAVPREHAFLLGAEDAHRRFRCLVQRRDELPCVGALTTGGSDEDLGRDATELPSSSHVRRRRFGCSQSLLAGKPAGALDLFAEPDLNAILANRTVAGRDQEAHSVGADIDYSDPHSGDCRDPVGRRPPAAESEEAHL